MIDNNETMNYNRLCLLFCMTVAVASCYLVVEEWETHDISGDVLLDRNAQNAAIVGPKLVLFGGLNDTFLLPTGEEDTFYNDVRIYNAASKKFALKEPTGTAPSPRGFYAAALDPDNPTVMKIFGGASYTNGGRANLAFYDDLFEYDIEENAWRQIVASNVGPSKRTSSSMFIDGGVTYIFGGATFTGGSNQLWKLEVVNETSYLWSLVPQNGALPSPRLGAVIRKWEKQGLYVLYGGELGGDINDVWTYNLATNTWTQLAIPTPLTPTRTYTVADVIDDYLVLFGGSLSSIEARDIGISTNQMAILNLNTLVWSYLDDCPYSTKRSAGGFIPGGRYVVTGGYSLFTNETQTFPNVAFERRFKVKSSCGSGEICIA